MMKRLWIGIGSLLMMGFTSGWSQEDESAEVFLEAYTDLFQERFFEALKQKGIENYDRAEALLLECKQMQSSNPVIDHELAKVLAARRQYASAEAYALTAVAAAPSEYWYMHTLMEILSAQYKQAESLSGTLSLEMPEIRRNLALWHLSRGAGKQALEYLENAGSDPETQALREQAKTMAGQGENKADAVREGLDPGEESDESTDELATLRNDLEALLTSESWDAALELGEEAVASYPLQPVFYLGIGRALMGKGAFREAANRLEEGEGFLLESGPVAIRLYEALAEVYEKLGDPEKAARYRTKAKAAAQ